MLLAALLLSASLHTASLHAATIDVRIERGTYTGPLTLHVGQPDGDHEPHWVTSRAVGAEPVRFEGLPTGMYVVALHGSAPTERFFQKINVGADDERILRLNVPKRRLTGQLTMGGKPLGGVIVTLQHDTWNWTSRLTADADGRISAPLWDEGDYLVDLREGNLTAPVKLMAALGGAEAKLDVALPNRRIRGVVVDEQGNPIAKVKVILRGEREGLIAPIPILTTKDGRFDYPGIEPGRHTMRVNADGYLAAADLSFDVTAADEVVERRITLASGTTRDLQIVDVHDEPVAGAVVLASTDGHVRALANTDARGRARIAIPKDSACAIWIVPNGGSLAAYRLERAAAAGATRIVVPEATASLDVQTLLSDGTPLPNVSFVLRYNGELAPVDVANLMRRGGNSLSTNADGVASLGRIPSGTYELWPYITADEAAALVDAAAPAKAPVHVTVAEGRHTATVRFEKRN